MTVLVTGGSGFIGSHLVDKLLEKNYDVEIIGTNLTGNEKAKIHAVDITDKEAVVNNISDNVDSIVHLAGLTSVTDSVASPEPFWNVNVTGTSNILEAARKSKVKKLVFMSTCEVYGNISEGKADEMQPVNPLSPYAASKFSAEKLLISAREYRDTPSVTILRGFNQYGPGQDAGSKGAVVAKFINNALQGKNLQVSGDGSQTRDYVFVKDTVEAIIVSLEKETVSGEIINIANGSDVSIRNLAEKISEIVGNNTKIETGPSRQGDIMRSCGSSEKAKKLLGWEAATSLEEGLKQTIDWYKNNLSN
jgi:UDP-glucose 4-epimerase